MNEKNLYQKDIIQKLRNNSEEINSLREKLSFLEKQNNLYQNKILDFKRQIKELLEDQLKNYNLNEEKKSCQNRIEDLEKEIINITNNCKTQNRQIENELENEVIFYRGLHESGMAKIDAADNIIKLNNAQNKYIVDLEEELEKLRSNSDVTICKLKIEHDIHFYNLKKKMMDYVKEIQHNMAQNNKDNLELNSKLGMLFKNQMLNELEHQALLIKELLKIKEKYEKIIFILNQELELHKKVEKTVLSKNMRYVNIIKEIDENYLNRSNSILLDNKSKKKKKISLSEKKIKNKRNYNINFFENNKNEDLDNFQLSIIKNIINNNNYREIRLLKNNKNNKNYYNEYIFLKKSYDELYKENQNIKEQLNTLKDKQKMYHNKFSGILKLYKSALEELLSDEELKNKSIIINKELINQGNYDSFTKEQKHSILACLIKKLLPLIDKSHDDNDIDIDILKNSFQHNSNYKTSSTQSSKKSEITSRNNNNTLANLTKLNFRSILDNRINICEKSNDFLGKQNKIKTFYKSNNGINSLKILNTEKNENIIKINDFDKDKFTNRNKSIKLFKCIKSKDKPLRFICLRNNFNKDYDLKSPVDTCLTKNNYLC